MDYKFECPHCAQSISAGPELFGAEVNCPTCGGAFIVPTLPAASEDEEDAADRAEQTAFDAEQAASVSDECKDEAAALAEMVEEMGFMDELARAPEEHELAAVRERLFALIRAGKWGGTEDRMKALLFEVVPALRP